MRKVCHAAFKDAGCSAMPKIVLVDAKGVADFSKNGAKVNLSSSFLEEPIDLLKEVATHEGTHARQAIDKFRYFIAKSKGNVNKGFESFVAFEEQNAELSQPIRDITFYLRAISKKPPMKKKSVEWKKTEVLMREKYQYSIIDLAKYLRTPMEIEAYWRGGIAVGKNMSQMLSETLERVAKGGLYDDAFLKTKESREEFVVKNMPYIQGVIDKLA